MTIDTLRLRRESERQRLAHLQHGGVYGPGEAPATVRVHATGKIAPSRYGAGDFTLDAPLAAGWLESLDQGLSKAQVAELRDLEIRSRFVYFSRPRPGDPPRDQAFFLRVNARGDKIFYYILGGRKYQGRGAYEKLGGRGKNSARPHIIW